MLADLLSESYDADLDEVWENERTATPVRAFAVRLHQTGCSVRETTTVLAELGVERSHGAVWNWVHRLADSGRDPPTSTRALLSCGPSERGAFCGRRSRRGSPSTRPLSQSTASSLGCTLQSTSTRR
ncbi:transposase [Natrinema gari JCM 14663]|uniref:Transposase n=1 Tax=Natrinema gari JCM 14663 TaxID=1230459 RepID=L9ZFK9_9EURY|nr:transposase [Natrinema gari JCM 14663]